MKKIIFFSGLFLSLVLGTGCNNKDTCLCQSYEECINSKCEMKEGHFLFGGVVHSGSNLFRGVVRGDICLDTFLLDAKPLHSQPPGFKTFNLVIKHGNVFPALFIPLDVIEISENQVFLHGLNSHTHFCLHEGRRLYADFKCKVYPDSVETEIYFFPEPDPSKLYIDTAYATLYKR